MLDCYLDGPVSGLLEGLTTPALLLNALRSALHGFALFAVGCHQTPVAAGRLVVAFLRFGERFGLTGSRAAVAVSIATSLPCSASTLRCT